MEKVARGFISLMMFGRMNYLSFRPKSYCYFSGETALYLHGLIDREYTEVCITVPNGYNATRLKSANVRGEICDKRNSRYGSLQRAFHQWKYRKTYDQERCICELIKDRKKYEVQNFQTAVKEYMAGKGKNLSRLVEYAEKLKIRDEVMKYVEVLV